MSYLLDTNVVSEIRKRSADVNVRDWFAPVPASELFISSLVFGDIRVGIERLRLRRDMRQAMLLEAWLATLEHSYAGRVLPVTVEVADQWGRIQAIDPLPAVDALLAATAVVHRLTLVTRNTADFARAGVPLLNPFEPQT